MDNLQQSYPPPNPQQPQPKNNKTLIIVLSAVIGVLVLLGSVGVYVAYLNAQKEAEAARVAKEKAEEEKRALQRSKEEAERRAEEERAARQAEEEKAARKAEEERVAREEAERASLQEAENSQPANKARGQVISVNKKADFEFVNGQTDAGYWITTVVKNVGESGDIEVVTFLSCSEGEWSRTQHLYFGAGESMTLRYFFHEPSYLVTSCQARAGASP